MDNINRFQANQENLRENPVCKFGPGGQFCDLWPPFDAQSGWAIREGVISKLFTIIEVIAVLLGLNPKGLSTGGFLKSQKSIPDKEDMTDAMQSQATQLQLNTTTDGTANVNNIFQQQPLLFPDDQRAGKQIKYKPKHSIRTYKRTSSKRAHFSNAGQGTLFDADIKRARSA